MGLDLEAIRRGHKHENQTPDHVAWANQLPGQHYCVGCPVPTLITEIELLRGQLAAQSEVIEAARAVSDYLPKWKFAALRSALDRYDAAKAEA